jgi:hypothetical protein
MAISTYTELQASLRNWSHRGTFHDDRLPEFIALAEKRIAQRLFPRGKETETELTATVSSRYVALPSDFQTLQALWIKYTTPRQHLLPRLPEWFSPSTTNGVPSYYCIDGSNIAFDCPAISAFTLDLRYVASLSIATTSTNDVLTRFPLLYLTGSMVELKQFEEDPDGAVTYEVRFQQLLNEAANAEHANRDDVPLETEVGAMFGCGGDILRGY